MSNGKIASTVFATETYSVVRYIVILEKVKDLEYFARIKELDFPFLLLKSNRYHVCWCISCRQEHIMKDIALACEKVHPVL
mmetsp:Transcript_18349/g.27156  ORF Transcript_18349/g.27156 Transcript_18349/m.27156 type:complete len:81 (-) Transcript_18349:71-313(-)